MYCSMLSDLMLCISLLSLTSALTLNGPQMVMEKKVQFPDLYEASVAEIQGGLQALHFTSVDLVKAYFARIDEVNLNGAELRAVLEKSPSAMAQAEALDHERVTKGARGPLHGIPVLLKDNIATIASEALNTTAGSFSLLGSIVPGDATVTAKLRNAGAIILGKLNLSEWAHFRSYSIARGWSARGGQSTNPYFPKADPCESSSGSGIAAAIGLATVTLGSETDGSITCPSSNNNVVGIKPTVGLTSRNGLIPISANQDTIGPIVRSVADAAIVLNAIADPDPADNFILAQPLPVPDYTKALSKDSLKGKRIGVPRRVFLNDSITGNDPSVNVEFEKALTVIRLLGATIVDPADLPSADEIVVGLNDYLAALEDVPSGVRTLAGLIAFNNAHQAEEKPNGFEDQGILIESEATTGFNATYFAALATNNDLARGIDAALKQLDLDALVLPAPGLTSRPAAIAGYPIVTIPLGFYPANVTMKRVGPETVYPAPGVPFGLSFFGTAFSEFELIGLAFAYEQATHTRLKRRAFAAAMPKTQLEDVVDK